MSDIPDDIRATVEEIMLSDRTKVKETIAAALQLERERCVRVVQSFTDAATRNDIIAAIRRGEE